MARSVVWSDRSLLSNLKNFDKRADRIISASVAYHASRASAYAKRNAPWQDRTTNARNGLFAQAERNFPSYAIVVGHSVPYGVWLEVRWSGRYQIIRPTVDREGPELMKTASQLYARMLRRL